MYDPGSILLSGSKYSLQKGGGFKNIILIPHTDIYAVSLGQDVGGLL